MRSVLWKQYAHDYCTVDQLARKYHKSEKWVRIQLDAYDFPERVLEPRPVVVVADAMFFGRYWGVVVMRDPERRENLYWEEIVTESPSTYQAGVFDLRQRGFVIQALVVDGRKGVREAFPGTPIQMCQFHQVRIVTRYLTMHPKLEAGQELRTVALLLSNSTSADFAAFLEKWHLRWQEFLKEKTINPETRHWQYTHRRLRAAYFSLKRNLPFLFTYEKYPERDIPQTTNCLEGTFSHTKTAMRIHRGLTQKRKQKLIDFLLRPKLSSDFYH